MLNRITVKEKIFIFIKYEISIVSCIWLQRYIENLSGSNSKLTGHTHFLLIFRASITSIAIYLLVCISYSIQKGFFAGILVI